MTRQVMVKGGELEGHPDWWQIVETVVDGSSGSWMFLRRPDGTFWEVASVDYFPRTGGNVRIDIGDQILDRRLLDRCREYYSRLQANGRKRAAMKTPHLITPGGNGKPIWGHCDSCDARFSSKEMEEMKAEFVQHLAKVHGENRTT